ncbi:MAG: hypothetical protein AAGU05_14650, partial [Anaerolineaceae bacterium]
GIFSGLTAYAEGWSYLVGGADMGGWIQLQSLSVKTALISLLAYESLPLMLGVVSLIMALQRREGLILALAAGAFIALMLIILYPGRGFAVFPWLTIPLWTMLCKYVLADYSLEDVELLPFLGLFALVMILAIFSAVNLKGVMTGNPADVAGTQLRYASILGSLLIILLGSGFVIWGWSVSTATKSLFAAVFVLLFFVNFQTLWYVVTTADHQRQEVWLSNRFADADLTARTVADYQRWNMGAGNQPGVWIAGVDSRALEWTLRNVDKLERTQALPASLDPEMIITSSSQQVALQDEYAGQDFVLSQQPVWDGLNAWSWMRWFFLRQTPHVDQSIILWVRMDQFPGYEANDLQSTN